jgi:hypothetical protein
MRRAASVAIACLLITACGKLNFGGGGGSGRTIALGSSQGSAITDTDPRMRGNRGPYQVWDLKGKRGQRLVIDMTSSAFDTYLYLRDSDGFLLAADDDSGDDNNARVRTILPRNGRYRIIATSFGQAARGDYRLAISEWPAPEAPQAGKAQSIGVEDTKDGLLEPGDEFSGDGPYQDRWSFDATAGQRLRIEMTSTDVDAYLILLGPDSQVVATNDDANGRDAAIVLRAAAVGHYTILATTYGDAPKVGAYRLGVKTVTGEFADPGQVQEISDGQTREGQLEPGDSTTGSGSYVDAYTFRAPSAGTLTAGMQSSEFDTYLTLQDANGAQLATDDDTGEGTNALLTHPVTAGTTYRLLAGTYGAGARGGAYRLLVRVSP